MPTAVSKVTSAQGVSLESLMSSSAESTPCQKRGSEKASLTKKADRTIVVFQENAAGSQLFYSIEGG